MILGDQDLKNYIQSGRLKISNMTPDSIRENGVDCRIADSFALDMLRLDKYPRDYVVDSHNLESSNKRFETMKFGTYNSVIIPSQINILLSTEEEFTFPDDLMAFCGLRSTVARMGFISPITIVDAGFHGTLTIEAFWGGKNPIKIYKGDRFLHVIFARLNTPCSKPYNGTYTGQSEVKLPKIMS